MELERWCPVSKSPVMRHHGQEVTEGQAREASLLGKALATGVAEQRSPVRGEEAGLPEAVQEIQRIQEPRAAATPEEAPAAR